MSRCFRLLTPKWKVDSLQDLVRQVSLTSSPWQYRFRFLNAKCVSSSISTWQSSHPQVISEHCIYVAIIRDLNGLSCVTLYLSPTTSAPLISVCRYASPFLQVVRYLLCCCRSYREKDCSNFCSKNYWSLWIPCVSFSRLHFRLRIFRRR